MPLTIPAGAHRLPRVESPRQSGFGVLVYATLVLAGVPETSRRPKLGEGQI